MLDLAVAVADAQPAFAPHTATAWLPKGGRWVQNCRPSAWLVGARSCQLRTERGVVTRGQANCNSACRRVPTDKPGAACVWACCRTAAAEGPGRHAHAHMHCMWRGRLALHADAACSTVPARTSAGRAMHAHARSGMLGCRHRVVLCTANTIRAIETHGGRPVTNKELPLCTSRVDPPP